MEWGVGTEKITVSTIWRVQNFVKVLGVLSESNVEAAGIHLGYCVALHLINQKIIA